MCVVLVTSSGTSVILFHVRIDQRTTQFFIYLSQNTSANRVKQVDFRANQMCVTGDCTYRRYTSNQVDDYETPGNQLLTLKEFITCGLIKEKRKMLHIKSIELFLQWMNLVFMQMFLCYLHVKVFRLVGRSGTSSRHPRVRRHPKINADKSV